MSPKASGGKESLLTRQKLSEVQSSYQNTNNINGGSNLLESAKKPPGGTK